MTDDRSISPHQSSYNARSANPIAAPILTWTLIQLAALLLAASGVRLWARPQPPATEAYAIWIMLTAQVAASALLFPWLLRDVRASVYVIISDALFVQLAGLLAQEDGWLIGEAAAGVCVWLIWLGILRRMLVSAHMELLAIALVATMIIGGGSLLYLRPEFTKTPLPHLRGVAWLILATLLVGTALALLLRRRRLRQVVHRSLT